MRWRRRRRPARRLPGPASTLAQPQRVVFAKAREGASGVKGCRYCNGTGVCSTATGARFLLLLWLLLLLRLCLLPGTMRGCYVVTPVAGLPHPGLRAADFDVHATAPHARGRAGRGSRSSLSDGDGAGRFAATPPLAARVPASLAHLKHGLGDKPPAW